MQSQICLTQSMCSQAHTPPNQSFGAAKPDYSGQPPPSLSDPSSFPLTPALLLEPAGIVHFPGPKAEVSIAALTLPCWFTNRKIASKADKDCGFGLRRA